MRRFGILACAVTLLSAACTDPAPQEQPPVAALAEVDAPALDAPAPVTHGDDPLPPKPPGLVAQLAPEHPWPCEGTGADGRRVQMVYAHNGTGNLAANRSNFEAITRRIGGTFLTSARKTGGERLVRFVTDGACNLSILDVVVSPGALSSFDAMVNEFAAAGLDQRDRIYHAWVEGNAYCGIGTVYTDDRPTGNNNDAYAQYSRSDRQCWNYAEAHEITHNLGGVQDSAPNSTGGLHTRDEYDVMSYPDGAPRGQMIQPFPCPDATAEYRLDCRDDDYFAASPPGGSYLATHWNVANAAALSRSAGTTSSTSSTTSTSTSSTSTTSTTVGQAKTTTDLAVPPRLKAGQQFVAFARVTGDCIVTGTISFYVSGRLLSRQVVSNDRAAVSLTISNPSRVTIRADYSGSSTCTTSRDSVRPRIT